MAAKRNFNFLLFTVLLLLQAGILLAQPGDPGDNPDNPVPITGIEYLVGGGVLYGVRSMLKARKKQRD